MIHIPIITNTLIFSAIALLHFYWALGGKAISASVVPTTDSTGSFAFKPSPFATLVVAFGLVLFALVTLTPLRLFQEIISRDVVFYGNIGIATIFFMRAIGDFRYVGFFKKIKDTPFARHDTRYYIPLCLFISLNSSLILIYL